MEQSGEQSNTTIAVTDCLKCKKKVPLDVFFCPFCGTVSLPNVAFKGASTAHFADKPASSLKPWKDPPPPKIPPKEMIKKKKTQARNIDAPNSKYPKKAVVKDRPSSLSLSHPPASIEICSPNVIIIDGQQYVKLMHAGPVSKSRSRNPSMKPTSGGQEWNGEEDEEDEDEDPYFGVKVPPPQMINAVAATVPAANTMDQSKSPPNKTPRKTPRSLKPDGYIVTANGGRGRGKAWKDFFHPLAAYDAPWLATQTTDVAIHISLLERQLGSRSQFWLRVGTVTTKHMGSRNDSNHVSPKSKGKKNNALSMIMSGKELNAPEDEDLLHITVDNAGTVSGIEGVGQELIATSEESELMVIGLLSNDEARCMTPPGTEWIDLDAITPNEHYVLTHLQSILHHIADRVVSVTPRQSLIDKNTFVDQFALVRTMKNPSSSSSSSSSNRFVRIEMVDEEFQLERLKDLTFVGVGATPNNSIRQFSSITTMAITNTSTTTTTTSTASATAIYEALEREINSAASSRPASPNTANTQAHARDIKTINNAATLLSSSSVTDNTGMPFEPPLMLHLDDVLSQVTCRIPLGRNIGANRILTTVRMSVIYRDSDPLLSLSMDPQTGGFPILHKKLTGNDDDDWEEALEDSRGHFFATHIKHNGNKANESKFTVGSESSISRSQIIYVPPVTHVKLLITPLYATGATTLPTETTTTTTTEAATDTTSSPSAGVQQKMLIFEVGALPYLIGPVDVNAVLTQSARVISEFVRNICGVLRYEYFTSSTGHPVIKLMVVGSSLWPEEKYVPFEQLHKKVDDDDGIKAETLTFELPSSSSEQSKKNDLPFVEDDESKALRAHSIKMHVQKIKEQHELEQEAEQERTATELKNLMRIKLLAVIRIQKITRGGISRERVKKLRMARWRGLGETLAVIEEEQDGGNAHKELKIARNIKGTNVMITGTFGYRDHTLHELQTNNDVILNLLITEIISSSEKERLFVAPSSSERNKAHDGQIGTLLPSDGEEASLLRTPLQTELQVSAAYVQLMARKLFENDEVFRSYFTSSSSASDGTEAPNGDEVSTAPESKLPSKSPVSWSTFSKTFNKDIATHNGNMII